LDVSDTPGLLPDCLRQLQQRPPPERTRAFCHVDKASFPGEARNGIARSLIGSGADISDKHNLDLSGSPSGVMPPDQVIQKQLQQLV
jgi:hypothetical protein